MNWYLKCLNQYADFKGRARRKEYWMFFLFNSIISFVLGLLDGLFGLYFDNEIPLGVLGGIYTLAVFIPGLAVSVRRLHDVGKSGWYYFLLLIPLVGAIIILVWDCTEGEGHENKWGPDPKQGE